VKVLSNEIASYIIGAAAATAAWVGAALSFVFSRRSYKIQSEQLRRMQPKLSIKIQDSYQKDFQDEFVVYAFQVVINNKSDCDNVINEAWLYINNSRGDGIKLKYGLSHDSTLTKFEKHPDTFQIPLKIQSHDVQAGWLLFKISKDYHSKMQIDSYALHLLDENNNAIEEYEVVVKQYGK
jgi:hypothetical protein